MALAGVGCYPPSGSSMVAVKDLDRTQVAFTDGEQLVRTGNMWKTAAGEQSFRFVDQTPGGKRRSSDLFCNLRWGGDPASSKAA
jgi:hypothetical protein